jgi:hypothetical protein
MTAWRVTHVDQNNQRHVLHVLAGTSQAAEEQVEQVYGPALYCACMNQSRLRG